MKYQTVSDRLYLEVIFLTGLFPALEGILIRINLEIEKKLPQSFVHGTMKWFKRIFGLHCVVMGAIPPHVIYTISEDGNFWNLTLFAMMLAAAFSSFVTFVVCQIIFHTKGKRFFIGIAASYLIILLLLLTAGGVTGDIAEIIMWMPVILLFGIPYMAPLVFMSWLGSVLIFRNKNEMAD